MKTNPIQRAFNRAAAQYDEHCQLQLQIGNTLIASLASQLETAETIVDLGCGTGIVTHWLAKRIHHQQLIAIDHAEQSLAIAANRLAAYSIQLHACSFDTYLRSHHGADLLFSNMALHWSPDFAATLRYCREHLSRDKFLAFSVPLTGTLRELTPHFSINPFTTLTAIERLLSSQSFDIVLLHQEPIVLSFADTLSALRSLKLVGANATHSSRPKGLAGKLRIIQSPITTLTYDIGYVIARRHARRVT